MPDPVLQLETSRLSVDPGGQVRTVVTVKNPGTIVEGYRLSVLGDGPSGWSQVIPEELQVYPGQDASAVVVFSPPGGMATGSGAVPFAVRAVSVVDASTSAVIEGDLDVGQVFGLQARITPATSSGRWRGRHLIEFNNWGNSATRLYLSASDPDSKLGFLVHPEVVDLPIGTSATAALLVRTRKPFLRGTAVRLPFVVTGSPDMPGAAPTGPVSPFPIPDPRKVSLDGAFQQRPILSKIVVAIATLLVVGIVAAVVLALRKPAPAATGPVTGKPNPPAVKAVAQGPDSIVVSWDQQTNISGYKLFTLKDNAFLGNPVQVDPTVTSQIVPNLSPGTQYCFTLQANRGDLFTLSATPVCATTEAAPTSGTVAPPDAPVLTVKAQDPTSIAVSWPVAPGIDQYQLFTLKDGSFLGSPITVPGVQTSEVVPNLTAGVKYCFEIQAIRAGVPSKLSAQACATTAAPAESSSSPAAGPPPAPAGLTAATHDAASVALTWTAPPAPMDSYNLFVETSDGITIATPSLNGAQTSALVQNLAAGTKYCFELSAVRGGQAGPNSERVCASTAAGAATSTGPAASGGTGASTTGAGGATSSVPVSGNGGGVNPPPNGGTTAPGSSTVAPATSSGAKPAPFGAKDWIAVVNDPFLAAQSGAQAAAQSAAAALAQAGVPAKVLFTGDYPGLLVLGIHPVNPAYLVYLGPSPSRDAALQSCQGKPGVNSCAAAQPNPGNG